MCDEWYGLRKARVRPATREFYTEILSGLKDHFRQEIPIASINSLACQKFIAAKRAKSDSPVRANRYLTVLRSLFMFALDEELIQRDPTRRLKREKETGRWCLLDKVKQERILNACEDWFRPVVLAALQTGARRADLLSTGKRRGGGRPLTWEDVDLAGRVITFRQTKERKVREVPIREELLGALKSLRRAQWTSQSPACVRGQQGQADRP